MATFQELVRNFDKIRDYMRDFYIYGFKSRADFDKKSARTYDNEKRRIESYLGPYIQWSYGKGGKRTFVSLNSAQIDANPLYAAWKSKSFTAADIMLHFYILDALRSGACLPVSNLTDRICLQSGQTFDAQIVRLKCKEYQELGILRQNRQGKAVTYQLCATYLPLYWQNALQFFQEAAPLGTIGSSIMDNEGFANQTFRFKHHFVVHTLEDGVLLTLLAAMRQNRRVTLQSLSERSGKPAMLEGVPVKIFTSTVTGRRYICLFNTQRRRYGNYRLDHVKQVESGDLTPEYGDIADALERNLHRVWGVSFKRFRKEILCMKLHIDEKSEGYILRRLEREGRGGEVLKVDENTFLYTIELFDCNEMSPWVKTFVGRILQLECSDSFVANKFYADMKRLQHLYLPPKEGEL